MPESQILRGKPGVYILQLLERAMVSHHFNFSKSRKSPARFLGGAKNSVSP